MGVAVKVLNRDVKSEIIQEIQSKLQDSASVFLVDYKGFSAQQFNAFRNSLRDADSQVVVYRNTLVQRALKEIDVDCDSDLLKEPTVFINAKDDVVSVAKCITSFIKDQGIGVIKGGFLGNQMIDVSEIQKLAKLPTKIELRAKVVSTLNAPIQNFVMNLSGLLRSFVYVLNSIKDQKSGGE